MKASELIQLLTALIEERGDLPVYSWNDEYGYPRNKIEGFQFFQGSEFDDDIPDDEPKISGNGFYEVH